VSQANADSGDTVVLADGTYTGVDLDLTASMSLIPASGAHPVLAGTGQETASVLSVTAGTVSVSGLTITGGQSAVETFDDAGSLTVSGSTLSGNCFPPRRLRSPPTRLPQQRRSRSHPGPLTYRESDSVD
jgi:phage tail tape-measure protein